MKKWKTLSLRWDEDRTAAKTKIALGVAGITTKTEMMDVVVEMQSLGFAIDEIDRGSVDGVKYVDDPSEFFRPELDEYRCLARARDLND